MDRPDEQGVPHEILNARVDKIDAGAPGTQYDDHYQRVHVCTSLGFEKPGCPPGVNSP